ncbi:MAG: VCBS repeat-containing protein, partial [Acidobacteriota bacterium]
MTVRAGRRWLWVLWAVLLVGALVSVARLGRAGGGGGAGRTADALARYGFALEDTSARRGVSAVHTAPTFDARLAHIMPQVASTGAAVAVADFDGDGWQDFYVTSSGEGSQNHLYRNRGDGTFVDVAVAFGVADVNRAGTGVSMGAVWGDYDNDGYEDLFVYKYGRPELFHNEHGGGFVAVGQRAGLPAWVNANSAVWLDYDGDGRLDLFVAGYWPETIDLWHLETTRIMPESFEYAENGGRKYLFHNLGDGRFEEVSEALGIGSRRWTLAAAAADLTGGGH